MANDTASAKYAIDTHGTVQGAVIGDNNTVTLIYQSGEQRIVPFMAPSLPPDHAIVGHERILNDLKASLFAGEHQALVVLPGVGKTTLAIEAASDKEVLQHFPDGVLWVSLGRRPDALAELKGWARALGVEDKDMARIHTEEEAHKAVSSAIGARRMLLVVDDVWQSDAAGAFLLGANCAHIVTSCVPEVVIDCAKTLTRVRELDNAESLVLLREFAREVVDAEPDEALELVRASGGLPLALVLLGKRLKRESRSGNPRRIRAALDTLRDAKERLEFQEPVEPGASPVSLAATIEMSYSNPSLADDARGALQALSVFRPKPHEFSEDMAQQIAGVGGALLDELDDVGLIECNAGRYTMHRSIAEYARSKLSPERSSALYHSAVDYFRERMVDIENNKDAASDYGRWYRYETPEWQTAKDNWLYYLSHAGEEAPALLAFLRAYFDAFWWWGCYLDFAFCDQLAKEWQQRETSEHGRQVLALVRKFQHAYPKETQDRRSKAWPEVEAALLQLHAMAGLDGDPSQWTDKERRHVRGITDIFLAEVSRFGRDDFEQAAKWYQEASELFEKNGDDWDMAWLQYHFADMNVQRGEPDVALQQLQRSLALGTLERDPEVVAQAYRVRGDIFLAAGELQQAAENFNYALFHAYRFQVEPLSPDPYTVEFYAQMASHVLQQLKAFRARQESQAVALSLELRGFWEPWWKLSGAPDALPDVERLLEEGDMAKLQAALFPPALPKKDIAAQGLEHEATVKAVLQGMKID